MWRGRAVRGIVVRMQDPDPPIQGVVTATIAPIQASKLRLPATMRGVALYLPQFEAIETDGDGNPDPDSVECTAATLEAAHDAAKRVIAMQGRLPLTESSIDVLNMAYAVLHAANARGDK